jgi:SAM-dependent methyltransferase
MHHPTVPPQALRIRVSGDGDVSNFLRAGEVISENMRQAIPASMDLFVPNSRILDFGCGCGRVVYFLKRALQGNFFGTDIDAEAIDWCASNMEEVATFSVNGAWPPIDFPDAYFDLICSVSIFTHLPKDMQLAWLKDLSRVMKPGAYALLTVQGEWLFPAQELPESENKKFAETGFFYHEGEETDGLPSFYRTTVHSERYVMEKWSTFFEIEKIIRRGVNNHQDIVVCRKR